MSSGNDYKGTMELSNGEKVKYGRRGSREWWDGPDSKGHVTYTSENGKDKMYSHYPTHKSPARGWARDQKTGEITRIDESKK